MSVLLIVRPKCTRWLAASHGAPGELRWVCRRDGQTDGRQTVILRYITLSARRGQRKKCMTAAEGSCDALHHLKLSTIDTNDTMWNGNSVCNSDDKALHNRSIVRKLSF